MFKLLLSPPQVLESVKLKQEVTQIEEERIQVLNNVEELEQKIKDLDNQMEESVREVGAMRRWSSWKHQQGRVQNLVLIVLV